MAFTLVLLFMKLFRESEEKRNFNEYKTVIVDELFSPWLDVKRLNKMVEGLEKEHNGSLILAIGELKEQADLVKDSKVSLESNETLKPQVENIAILLIFALLEVIVPGSMETDESTKILYRSVVSSARYALSDLYKSNELIRSLVAQVIEMLKKRSYSNSEINYLNEAFKIILS